MKRIQAVGLLAVLQSQPEPPLPLCIDAEGDDTSPEFYAALVHASGLLDLCETEADLLEAVRQAAVRFADGSFPPEVVACSLQTVLADLQRAGGRIEAAESN